MVCTVRAPRRGPWGRRLRGVTRNALRTVGRSDRIKNASVGVTSGKTRLRTRQEKNQTQEHKQ
jgi:hypothetical protein